MSHKIEFEVHMRNGRLAYLPPFMKSQALALALDGLRVYEIISHGKGHRINAWKARRV
jgi:hypothetical protein